MIEGDTVVRRLLEMYVVKGDKLDVGLRLQ
jgi:hypothetical protein